MDRIRYVIAWTLGIATIIGISGLVFWNRPLGEGGAMVLGVLIGVLTSKEAK